MKTILKNWKTTLAGAVVLLLTVLQATHKISAEQFTAVSALCTAFGLSAAKDAGNQNP